MIFLSVRNRDEILEMNTLYKLKEKYKNFSFKITLTREKPFPNSQFLYGRVDVSLQKIFKDLSTHQVLICWLRWFCRNFLQSCFKIKC